MFGLAQLDTQLSNRIRTAIEHRAVYSTCEPTAVGLTGGRKLQLALRSEGLSFDALIGTRAPEALIDMGSDDEG